MYLETKNQTDILGINSFKQIHSHEIYKRNFLCGNQNFWNKTITKSIEMIVVWTPPVDNKIH